MNARKRRIAFIAILILVSTAVLSLVLFALQQNMNLFFTPSQLLTHKSLGNNRIRVGGMVVKGSLKRGENLDVNFVISDFEQNLQVFYQGILPDLFREGQGVVVLGRMQPEGHFNAEQVLAKHDETYMPPELKSLKKEISP